MTPSSSTRKHYSHTPNAIALGAVVIMAISLIVTLSSAVVGQAQTKANHYKQPAHIISQCRNDIYNQVPEVLSTPPRLGHNTTVTDHGNKVVEVQGESDSYTFNLDKGPQKVEYKCTLDASNNTIIDVDAKLVSAQKN